MIISNGYRKRGFDASNGAILKASDMSYWMNSEKRTDPAGVCFQLGEDIEEVEPDFFELLPTLCEIWVINPKCKINLSDAAKEIIVKNNVLIRGYFDSSAENFARQLKLNFLHLDTEIARAGNYFEAGGADMIRLCFYSDGSAYINQDCHCQGSSAGSDGGGEVNFNLPKDFYLYMSAKDIAGQCWGTCYDKILSKGILASLIGKAKAKHGFLIEYSKTDKES